MADSMFGDGFKYTKLRDRLRRDIVSGRYVPGDKLPSENELCAKYKLSNNTVREAILSLVNEGLVCRTRGKGTFVAEITPARKTMAVVIPRMGGDPLAHDYDVMPSYVAAIESEAHDIGWDVLLYVYNHDFDFERIRLASALNRSVDGVISFFSCCRDNVDCILEIRDAGIPVIMVDTYFDDLGVDYIGTDNHTGSYKAIMRFADAGFERICYFNSDHANWNPITPRLRGYQDAMRAMGKHPHVVYPVSGYGDSADGWEETGYHMASEMLGYIQHPFAIFAVTPALAIGAWKALSEAGIPPESVALGCFDNPRISLPEQMLSINVIQPLEEIGRRAVRMINDRFTGRVEHNCELVEPELVVSGANSRTDVELAVK